MSGSTTAVSIRDFRDRSTRDGLLDLNNANAVETSPLTRERLNALITQASVGLMVPPAAAFLLAFQPSDAYDGGHFLWFRERFETFLYIDRVVVCGRHRRRGLGRILYGEVFSRAAEQGQRRVVCEVNREPPNPVSDRFHANLGFVEVGRATIDEGAKTVRYLAAEL